MPARPTGPSCCGPRGAPGGAGARRAAAPLRLRRPRHQPVQLVRRRAGRGRWHGLPRIFSTRHRRRGLRLALLRRRQDRPALRRLVRRELPEDDDPDHPLGDQGVGFSPTARNARPTCATTRRSRDGYEQGWNVRYTTELTRPVWYYLRGEEYSRPDRILPRPDRCGRRSTGTTTSPRRRPPTA